MEEVHPFCWPCFPEISLGVEEGKGSPQSANYSVSFSQRYHTHLAVSVFRSDLYDNHCENVPFKTQINFHTGRDVKSCCWYLWWSFPTDLSIKGSNTLSIKKDLEDNPCSLPSSSLVKPSKKTNKHWQNNSTSALWIFIQAHLILEDDFLGVIPSPENLFS